MFRARKLDTSFCAPPADRIRHLYARRNPVLKKLLYFQLMDRNPLAGLPIIKSWSGDTLGSKRATSYMGFVR